MRKKVRYERDAKAMKCCLQNIDGGELTCRMNVPAKCRVGRCCRWLVEERKTRKGGRQLKCTMADGEMTISNCIPSRFETFVVYALIGRTAECICRGSLAHHHSEVEDIAV